MAPSTETLLTAREYALARALRKSSRKAQESFAPDSVVFFHASGGRSSEAYMHGVLKFDMRIRKGAK